MRPSASVRACVIRWRARDIESIERDVDAGRRHPTFRVEDVGADGGSRGFCTGHGSAILRTWERCGSRSATSTLAPAGRRRPPRRSRPSGGCCPSSPVDPLPLDRRVHVDPVWGLPPGAGVREPHVPPDLGSWRSTRAGSASARFLPVRRLFDGLQGGATGGEPFRVRRRDGGEMTGRTDCARSAGAVSGGRPGVPHHRGRRLASSDGPRLPGRHRRHRHRLASSGRRRRRWRDHDHRARPRATWTGASRVVDATGMLVLPGVVDVHTHTRVASEAEPTAFSRIPRPPRTAGRLRSCCSTTLEPGRRRLPSDRCEPGCRNGAQRRMGTARSTTASRLRCRGTPTTRWPSFRRRSRPGVATSKAFMVFDFRLPDQALFDAMRLMGERGGMLQVHCEDPVLLDAAVAGPLQRGDVLPRYHAVSRPPFFEAVARPAPGVRSGHRLARARRPSLVGCRTRRGSPRQGGRCPGDRRDLSRTT